MRLEWLEDILAVAQTGSFSEAAERRHLTQSAFSRRIRNIEDYLGVELFDRARKPVQLRPTTRDQHDQISRLAAMLHQLVADLQRGDRETGNRIVIASQHALTTSLTPPLVQSIERHHDDIHIRLRSANLDDCFALLLSRQADIALVYRLPGEDHLIQRDYIETLVLGQDRLIPIFVAAKADTLTGDLGGGQLPLIAYPGEVFLGRVLDEVILPRLRGQLHLVSKAETALTLAALELATVGVGVAWVPASLARVRIEDGSIVDLSNRLPHCVLQVTAIRLAGASGPVETTVWDRLAAQAGR